MGKVLGEIGELSPGLGAVCGMASGLGASVETLSPSNSPEHTVYQTNRQGVWVLKERMSVGTL